jgi:hypothetical protein
MKTILYFMAPIKYLSEIFRIVEGAMRLDGEKVKNYAFFLADKLQEDGEIASAKRLRSIIENEQQRLVPSNVEQRKPIPVDPESRFPLLERTDIDDEILNFVFPESHFAVIEDYISLIQSRAALEANRIQVGTNFLLYGPPGCGKTHLAKYIAYKLSLPLCTARIDGLISSFLGSTAKNIQAIFDYASRTPCLLLLDEFDAIAKFRNDQQELGELKRVVNSFIQNLDSHSSNTLVIAATNHEELLDPAVWRRFDFLLNVQLPDYEQRRLLWERFSAPVPWQSKDLKILADLSEAYSGATIKSVCSRLTQRMIITTTPPTLREAIIMLLSFRTEKNGGTGVLTTAMIDNLPSLIEYLVGRNPDLYSLSMIGEIAGRSKATMSRAYSNKTIERRATDGGRSALYQSNPTQTGQRQKGKGRRG